MKMQPQQDQIEDLKSRIADLKARLPAHSVPASMMIELDELEDELAQLQAAQPAEERGT